LANEAQDTRRSSHTEQQCKVAVGNRGEVGRRMHDGGGATYAQRSGGAQEAATEERRWRDGGATEAATRAGRWRDGGATVAASFSTVARRWLPPFRLLFGGGARPATQTSWTEAQSAMERLLTEVADGEVARERSRERR